MNLELSRRIRSLREQYGYNQKYASEKLRISPQACSHYENGRRTPDIEMLYKLSKFYHVSMEFLLTGEQNEDLNHSGETIVFRDARDLSEEDLKAVRLFIEYLKFRNFLQKQQESGPADHKTSE